MAPSRTRDRAWIAGLGHILKITEDLEVNQVGHLEFENSIILVKVVEQVT